MVKNIRETIKFKLNQTIKRGLKIPRNKFFANVLRLILNDIYNEDIASKRKINDDDIVRVLKKMVKQRIENIEILKQSITNKRATWTRHLKDEIDTVKLEMKVINKFLSQKEVSKYQKEMISKLKREFKWEPFGLSSLASTLEKGNKNVTKVVRNEPSGSDLGARLKKLRQMYKDGILSKVEFEKAKNKLLK